MQRLAAFAIFLGLAAIALDVSGAKAQQRPGVLAQAEPLVAQRPVRPVRRVRPQIRVQPRYPYRTFSTPYPLPYDYEFPGPNATRNCTVRYVQDFRPSGTVIVLRMRCWWVPG